jgi:hypothetical protein
MIDVQTVDTPSKSQIGLLLGQWEIADYLITFRFSMPEMGIAAIDYTVPVDTTGKIRTSPRLFPYLPMPHLASHPEKELRVSLDHAMELVKGITLPDNEFVSCELKYSVSSDAWFWVITQSAVEEGLEDEEWLASITDAAHKFTVDASTGDISRGQIT